MYFNLLQIKKNRKDFIAKAGNNDGNQASPLDLIMQTLTSMRKQMNNPTRPEKRPFNVNMIGPCGNRDDEEKNEMDEDVEIGTRGCGIVIKRSQWDQAIGQATPTAMATCLTDINFPLEVLLILFNIVTLDALMQQW